MTHTKGKASQNNEVRQLMDGRWAIMSRANNSINYYAKDEADAHQTLREWDAAPEMLEALKMLQEFIEGEGYPKTAHTIRLIIKNATE
jgi:hypothetical protein